MFHMQSHSHMHKMNHTTKEYCDPLRQHTAKIDKVVPALGRKRNHSSFEHFKKKRTYSNHTQADETRNSLKQY